MDTGRYRKKLSGWLIRLAYQAGFEPSGWPLEQESEVFPLDHSIFLIQLHLMLIITLRMDTGWTQADIKNLKNLECFESGTNLKKIDLNPGPLEQESEGFPLDHSIFLVQLHLTLIITLRMDTGWKQADMKMKNL